MPEEDTADGHTGPSDSDHPGVNIDWTIPPFRSGIAGFFDRFFGPHYLLPEYLITFIPTLALTIFTVVRGTVNDDIHWDAGQAILAFILAFDIIGGAIAKHTSTTKRWYHRPSQGVVQHVFFIAIHLIHILLVTLFLKHKDWLFFGCFGGYLLLSAVVVLVSPLFLRRPLAIVWVLTGYFLDFYWWQPTKGLEWFVTIMMIKLVMGNACREEPYRPLVTPETPGDYQAVATEPTEE